jgi:hypothetical protein
MSAELIAVAIGIFGVAFLGVGLWDFDKKAKHAGAKHLMTIGVGLLTVAVTLYIAVAT